MATENTNNIHKQDDYESLLNLYNRTRSIDEKRLIKSRLNAAQQDAYDAESSRQLAFGIAAFIWAFNVIDAAVFFPDKAYSIGGPASISLDTGDSFKKLELKLAVSF